MKNKLVPAILLFVGVALLALADYGIAHDTSSNCVDSIDWQTCAVYAGIITLFIGLIILLRSLKISWPLTVVLSVSYALTLAIINGIIAISVSPGGLLDCLTF